ncbi:MAG TPA: caspase family protein, partial [Candidatus Sulfotelmatobacter sp.]|nr:caspase family protein [Candidatus Sulfotelmatobacter sp.]
FQAAPAAPAPVATPPAAGANQPASNADRARENKRQAAQQAELDRLRREVETLHRQLDSKQDELNRTQQQLEQLRSNLQRRSDDAAGQRKQLAELRAELDAKRQSTNADAAGIAQLEKNVADREAALRAKDKEVADLRASLASVAEKSRVQQANLEKLQKQSAAEPPSIQLIEPELAATRGQPTIKLPGPVASLVVVGRVETVPGLVSLTVNGREEKVDNQVFRSSVPVGDTEEHVRIVAVDRNGRKTTLEFVVPPRAKPAAPAAAMATQRAGTPRVGHPRPTEPVKFGSYHALVIGNDDYRFFKPLRTAIADAKEVARVLQQDYGFDVKLLIDAKRYDILSALNELRAKLTFNDNLLIYYAGHGELDEVNQRGNWLPVDAEPNSTANWISNISITDVLNAMNVRQLLIVADSCYSGTLTRAAVGHIEGGIDDAERVRLMQVMLQQHSRMALTSGGIEPVLDSVGGKHSAFAQAFIDVLKANVGVLPGQEMFQDLQSRVIAAADRFDQHQVPEYAPIKFAGHESGDFFFVRVANQ